VSFRQEQRNDILIVSPAGRLDGSNSPPLEQAVVEAINSGGRKLAFDFSDLDYISSAGLRVVLVAGKRLNAEGGKLVLIGLRGMVKDVFDMSGFDRLFPVVSTIDEAMQKL
jgi:anti-anti-sigma factor